MTEPERFDRKDATAVTREALARAGQALPPAGAAVEEDARRGFVGALEPPVIMHRLGFPLVDLSTLDFVDWPLPDRQEGRRGHAGAVVRTTMPGLVALTFGDQYAEQAPAPQVEGDAPLWDGLIGALDRFTFWFPVVTSPDAPLPPPA